MFVRALTTFLWLLKKVAGVGLNVARFATIEFLRALLTYLIVLRVLENLDRNS